MIVNVNISSKKCLTLIFNELILQTLSFECFKFLTKKESCMDDVLLTDIELCTHLRITIQTLYRHLQTDAPYLKKLKCNKIGSSRRWSKKSVDDYINSEKGA